VLAAQRNVKRRAHGTTGRALSGRSSRWRSSSAVPVSADLPLEHRRSITARARQRKPGVHVDKLLGPDEGKRPHVGEAFGHLILTRMPQMFLQP
jgi:hypothetical protein